MKTFTEINADASISESQERASMKEIIAVWVISIAVFSFTAQLAISSAISIAKAAGL